jgi:uncharacterized repeat protein (TIGR04076 family)
LILIQNIKENIMKRRDFLGKTGCSVAGLMTVPLALDKGIVVVQSGRKRYKIDIEIYEARKDTWCHKKGDQFEYPKDWGKICPWFRASMIEFIRVLEYGGTLSWKYEGTPYEKVMDPDGVTTEYVRCPDPTANLVAKFTRTLVS